MHMLPLFLHHPHCQTQDKKKQHIQLHHTNKMANVVELKVGLHCDDCIKKILKAIKKIEDIETYDVDKQLNKVVVTGNVTRDEVIRVLHKIGKSATNWGQDQIDG